MLTCQGDVGLVLEDSCGKALTAAGVESVHGLHEGFLSLSFSKSCLGLKGKAKGSPEF